MQAVKQCADEVLDVIPLVMRSIRAEMRKHRDPGLTVPQFRALSFAGRNKGGTLSELAGHLGLMAPAVSKIVDGLVVMGLLVRTPSLTDRRCLNLVLTVEGQRKLAATQRVARDCLAQTFSALPAEDCRQISLAMRKLGEIFREGTASGEGAAGERRAG